MSPNPALSNPISVSGCALSPTKFPVGLKIFWHPMIFQLPNGWLYGRRDTTHAELISALGMTKGAASKIISKLEAKGFAARQLSKDSLREQIVFLTNTGNELVPKLAALADENDAYFFWHLADAQRQSLMAVMQELVIHHQLKQVPTR